MVRRIVKVLHDSNCKSKLTWLQRFNHPVHASFRIKSTSHAADSTAAATELLLSLLLLVLLALFLIRVMQMKMMMQMN